MYNPPCRGWGLDPLIQSYFRRSFIVCNSFFFSLSDSRPTSSSLCIFLSVCTSTSCSPGPPRPPQQQFLVVSDRSPAASGLRSVALNYGTLPRAPPRHALPPSSTSSLPRPRTGPGPAPLPDPQNLYATLGPPRRSTNTSSGHHQGGGLPDRVNGTTSSAPQHLRVSGDLVKPLRLDVPPETDWRLEADFRTAQLSSARRHQPLQRTNRGPYRAPQLCSLCLQTPVEPSCPYCASCRAHVARFRLSST